MSNIKLYEAISKIIDLRPKIPTFDVWEVAEMVNARYDWEEFGDLDTETVAAWIASIFGWDKTFSIADAEYVCDMASDDGYRGASGWYK